MELKQVLAQRYSLRKYSPRKVEPEKLEQLLEAARLAPSAANLQPVRLIVVTGETGLVSLGRAAKFYGAPLGIIACVDKSAAWVRSFDGKNHGDIDASIMTDHIMLRATELGLGSVWICRFDPDIIRTDFQLPASWEPVNILALGYPAEDSAPSKMHAVRKSTDEYVSFV